MTRSSGPNRQAPQWQQQRPDHDPQAPGQQYNNWQQPVQGGYPHQGAPDQGHGVPDQGYYSQSQQGHPDQFGGQQPFGQPAPQPPHAPTHQNDQYYAGTDPHQTGQTGGHADYAPQHGFGAQPGYADFNQPHDQSNPSLHHAPDLGQPQGYSQFDTPPTQPPSGYNGGNYPQFGTPEEQAYGQFRPSTFDQQPHQDWQQPPADGHQSAEANPGLYDFGNYMPAGASPPGRPQFGDPDYVPPQEDWNVNTGLNTQPPAGQFGGPRPEGYDGLPQGLQTGAVTQHSEGYGDEGDEEYDDYYDEEESGTGRKLIIAGALVSAIVVGGGFAYGYNTLFGDQPAKTGTPVVAAAEGASKEQPTNAGGRTFDNKDSKLLGKLGSAGGTEPEQVGNRVRTVPTLVVGPDGRLVVPEAADNQTGGSQTPQVEPAGGSQEPASVTTTTAVPGMIVSGGTGPVTPAPIAPQTGTVVENTRVPPASQQLQPQVQPQQSVQVASAAQTAATPPATQRRNSKYPPLPVRSGITKPQFTTASAVTPAATRTPGVASANVRRVVPSRPQQTAPRSAPAQPQRVAVAAPSAAASSGGANGYVAVLSTKRSRIDALTSFADLQQKYGSILSTKVPDVRRADLTSRGMGVMYRAVVGPPGSKQAAGQLCNRLKTAGYSGCWVTAY